MAGDRTASRRVGFPLRRYHRPVEQNPQFTRKLIRLGKPGLPHQIGEERLYEGGVITGQLRYPRLTVPDLSRHVEHR
jgi:hypothetical protein